MTQSAVERPDSETMLELARDLQDDLRRFRRELHQDPEVGLQLPRTQARLLRELEGLGLEIVLGSEISSVVAILRGGGVRGATTPTVLLRSDLDALPISEQSGESFSSRNGSMHACGHDMHAAMLVGAARLLSARAASLPGDIVFAFQPGEEGYNGAKEMLAEGLLEVSGNLPVATYAFHVQSVYPPRGVIATRAGTMFSASSRLHVSVNGNGGHGSTPHMTLDPIPVAAEMILALQQFVTRRIDIFDPAVISVGSINGGTAENVISDSVTFKATVRSFSAETQEQLRVGTRRLCEGIAQAHGLRVEVTFEELYPAVVNDNSETKLAVATLGTVFGGDRVELAENPMAQSEDYSYVLQRVPGLLLLLGAAYPDADPLDTPTNHSPRVRFDDALLYEGAAAFALLAEERLWLG